MSNRPVPTQSKYIRKSVLGLAIGLILVVSSNAFAGSGFLDSVREFFGMAPVVQNLPTEPNSAQPGAPEIFAARVASVSGNWNNTATWGGQSVPIAGDTVTINSGITVTVTADAACASIDYLSTATANTFVTINSGITLTVSGAVTIPRANTNINTMAVGAGILNAGSIAFTNGGGTNRHQLTISTGTVTVTGDITTNVADTSPTITFSGAGLLRVGVGLLTTGNVGGTFTASTGTVEYNGAGAQTIRNFTYNNLTLSGGGTKTLGGATTVNTTATIESGVTFTPAGFTFSLSSANLNVNGTLDFTDANGSVTSSAATSVLTMGSTGLIRTLDLNGLGPAANASLIATAAFTTTSIDTIGTVEYYRNVTSGQVVTDRNYNNLTITGSTQTKTWTIAAARTVNGNVTINTAAPLTMSGAQILNVRGNWSNSGTFTPGTGTVALNGTAAAQTISGTSNTSFTGLTLNNANGFTLSQSPTVNGALAFTAGIVTTGANTLTVAAAGTTSRTTGYVIGNLQRAYSAAGSKTFDVGTANGYSPVAANVTAGTGSLTVAAVQGAHPNMVDPGKALSRYWTLTGAGITATLTFNYLDPIDIPGTATEGNFVIQKFNGVFTQPGGSVNTGAEHRDDSWG